MSAAVLAAGEKPVIVKRAVVAVLGALGVAALAAGLLLPADRAEDRSGAVDTTESADRAAPPVDLPSLTGEGRVGLPSGKPAVLYFFASWCVPCAEELPVVKQASTERDDVSFLGVDHLDHADDGRAFLERLGAGLPAGHDPGGNVAVEYQLRGLPATVFIGADGRIVSTLHGQLDRATLDERIDELVAS